MKKSILHLLLPLLVTAFLAACSKEPTPWVPDSGEDGSYLPGEYQLPLIETTDLHGYIVSASNGALHYRMAFIADKVNDIRGRTRSTTSAEGATTTTKAACCCSTEGISTRERPSRTCLAGSPFMSPWTGWGMMP